MRDDLQRVAQAQHLMQQGQELCAERQWTEGTKLLRQAYELATSNELARAVLCDALVEHARLTLASDENAAEPLIEEALHLNPLHIGAKIVLKSICNRKRQESLAELLAEARRLQADGDLTGAQICVGQGLAAYPSDPALLEMRDVLERERTNTNPQNCLNEFHSTERELENASEVEVAQEPLASEFESDASALAGATQLFSGSDEAASFELDNPRVAPPTPGQSTRSTADVFLHPSAESVAKPVPPARKRKWTLVAGASAVVLVGSVAVVTRGGHDPSTALATKTVRVEIRTTPPGALIRVNHQERGASDLQLNLVPGSYQVEASLDGYEASDSAVQIKAGRTNEFQMILMPVTPAAEVASDNQGAKVALDNKRPNFGSLLIVTRQDNAQIYVNGKPYSRTARTGELRIPELAPGDYSVRVVKDGFRAVAEQKVTVAEGAQATLTFGLQPLAVVPSAPVSAATASLKIQNGTPGSEVLLDQRLIGAVQADGTFQSQAVPLGDHAIELRKDHYHAVRLQRQFVLGSVVALSGNDAVLATLDAELKIAFSPSDATVTVGKLGEPAVQVPNGSDLKLAPGSYQLLAITSDKFTRSGFFQLNEGDTRTLNLDLSPAGMANWQAPNAWKNEHGYYTRKAGGILLYQISPVSGTFLFRAKVLHGKRLQWVLNFQDNNNYELFEMDESHFYRSNVRDGKVTEEIKMPIKMDKREFRSIQVQLSPDKVVHQVLVNDTWVVLDTWTEQGTNLTAGKFGWSTPGNDEVALSDFRFYPSLVAASKMK
jgi:hypothetical protein